MNSSNASSLRSGSPASDDSCASNNKAVALNSQEGVAKAKYAAVTQATQFSFGRYQEFDSVYGNLLIPTLPSPSLSRT